MGFKLSVRNIAGIAAAPFTGGASLLATDMGQDFLGELTGSKAAKKANQQNIALQNYWNQKNIEQQDKWNNKSIELANTAHQREMADLKAAGLNPVLAANGGASTPALGAAVGTSPSVNNTMPGGYMGKIVEGANVLNILSQAKNLQVNSALQKSQTAQTNAQTAQTMLDTAIKRDMKPATIKQAYQNAENAVAQQKLINAQTAQTASQENKIIEETRKLKGGKAMDYLGTDPYDAWSGSGTGGKKHINTKYFYPN